MSETNVFNISKAAFITAIVSVGLNPVSLVVGYWVGQYLKAPKVYPQYVSADPYVFLPRLSKSTIDMLNKNRRVKNGIRSTIARLYPADNKIQCRTWLDGEPWDRENCYQIVFDSTKGMRSTMIEVSDNILFDINELEKWSPDKAFPFRPVPHPSLNQNMSFINTITKPHIEAQLKNLLGEVKSDLAALDIIIHELQNINAPGKKDKRSGEIAFQTGVLNSGDSDAVIFPKAELIYTGTKANLVSERGYVVLKSHSFEKMNWIIDEPGSTDSAKEKLRRILENHEQQEFVVKIKVGKSTYEIKGFFPP